MQIGVITGMSAGRSAIACDRRLNGTPIHPSDLGAVDDWILILGEQAGTVQPADDRLDDFLFVAEILEYLRSAQPHIKDHLARLKALRADADGPIDDLVVTRDFLSAVASVAATFAHVH